MLIQKQNESYTLLISENESDINTLQKIHDFLKAEKPDAKYNFKVQRGWESPYTFFTEVKKSGNQTIMKILNGHLSLLSNYGIEYKKELSEYSELEVQAGLSEIIKMMPFEPYDYQLKCAKDNLLNPKQISLACTSAGKSLIIFLVIYFLYKKNKSGLICVPSISLTTQIFGDFRDYFSDAYSEQRDEFLSSIELQGGGKESTFSSFLTITTWQSLMNRKEHLDKAEFILCDELQKYSSTETSEIVKLTNNAYYKWGLTGTLPEDPMATMNLIGMFGAPKRYIRACELIERGLGTPVEIISFIFKYSDEEKRLFNSLPKGQYAKQLGYIKEHEKRNTFITDLTYKIRDSGNTILLYSHIEHMKNAFRDLMKRYHTDIEVQNKDITGKKSFEFQKKFGIYFLNGEDNAETRELTRKILEEQFFKITLEDDTIIRLYETDLVRLTNGNYKIVKDLTKDDDICEKFIGSYNVSK